MSANSLIRPDRVRVSAGHFTATLKFDVAAGIPDTNQTAYATFALSTPWGGRVSFRGLYQYNDAGVPHLGWEVTAVSDIGGVADDSTVGYPAPHTADVEVTGTFSLYADADIVHVRDGDADPDADGFPTYGGPRSAAPWPLACHTRTYRTTRPGGEWHAEISVTDGTLTAEASSTGTITTRADIGTILLGYPYDVGPNAIWVQGSMDVTEYTSALEATWEHGYGLTSQYAFSEPTITYGVTNGDATTEATATSIRCEASDGAIGGASNASVSLLVQPSKAVTVHGALRSADGPASGSYLLHRGASDTLTVGSEWTDAVEQAGGWWCSAELDGVAQTTGLGASEWERLYYYVDEDSLTANNHGVDEWRVLLHTQGWECMTITQALDYTVDACDALTVASGPYAGFWSCSAGGTLAVVGGRIVYTPGAAGGVLSRTFSNPAGSSGYRYLTLQTEGESAGQPVESVTIGTKQWTRDAGGYALRAGSAPADLTVDLCGPTNMSVTVDALATRWGPWESEGAGPWDMPTDDDHVDADGAMWGVQRVRGSIMWTVPAAGGGLDYTLHGLTLGRYAGRSVSDLSVQPASDLRLFSDYTVGPTQTETFILPYLLGYTDGRFSMEECAAEKIIVTTPLATTITWVALPISDLLLKVNATDESWPVTGTGVVVENALRNVGWTAAYAGGTDTADGADWSPLVNGDCNRNREALWFCGAGGVYGVWGGEPGWRWAWDMDRNAATAETDWGQVLVDVFEWDPGLGDVYGLAGDPADPEGEPTIGAKRIFGARANGLVLTQSCIANSGASVALGRPAGAEGSSSTGADGYYATGDPGASEPSVTHYATATYPGIASITSNIYPLPYRWQERRCFRLGGSVELSYAVGEADSHVRAYTTMAGALYVGAATGPGPVGWVDRLAVASGASKPHVVRDIGGDGLSYVHLLYQSGGSVWTMASADEGVTWSAARNLGSGSYGAMLTLPDGARAYYRVSGGSIVGRLEDQLGNLLKPDYTVTTCDDAYITVKWLWPEGAALLYYVTGGAMQSVRTVDGYTFDAPVAMRSAEAVAAGPSRDASHATYAVDAGAITGSVVDHNGAEMRGGFDAVAVGVDAGGIGAGRYQGADGEQRTSLLYASGGTIVSATSADGITFSEA